MESKIRRHSLKAKYIENASLSFYFVPTKNEMKSVLSQKIFDPTLTLLTNNKQLD